MIQHDFMLAEPFPHLVLDGFAPEATLRRVAAGFAAVAADAWIRYEGIDERGKCACNQIEAMPEACRDFIAALSSTTAARLSSGSPESMVWSPTPCFTAADCTRPSGAAFWGFT